MLQHAALSRVRVSCKKSWVVASQQISEREGEWGGLAAVLPFLHLAQPPRVFILYWREDAGGQETLGEIVATVNTLKAGMEKHQPVSIDELILADDDAWLVRELNSQKACRLTVVGVAKNERGREIHIYIYIKHYIYICMYV